MNASGAQVIGGAPNLFRDFLDAERIKWTPIVKKHAIKAD
ncbi:MAG: hypothetical protein JWN13_1961 [Betaproteobacteria bacterium]|nr:hypothetical protein [Betaproteobacteria bacterium]